MIVTWIWQAGGVASRNAPVVDPSSAKGLKIRRGGSREVDLMLKAADAAVISLPATGAYQSCRGHRIHLGGPPRSEGGISSLNFQSSLLKMPCKVPTS